jgi:hypothetical protein
MGGLADNPSSFFLEDHDQGFVPFSHSVSDDWRIGELILVD